jgi:hypothetical protein
MRCGPNQKRHTVTWLKIATGVAELVLALLCAGAAFANAGEAIE